MLLWASALTAGSPVTVADPLTPVGPGARIFVTKCYPGHGRLTSADFAQLADAGFTVVVDMWKDDLPGFVQGAAAQQLDVLTWNPGQEDADLWGQPHTVTREGKTTRYCVPHNSVGWWVVEQALIDQARMALTNPNLKGAVLDFEIYDPNKTDGYCESYDDMTWSGFFTGRGESVPNVAAAQRRGYLSSRNLLSAYIDYNCLRVGQRALATRQAIDEVNPRFQIGVYGWGILNETVKRNLATAAAPVLDFDATTYARSVWESPLGYDPNVPDRIGLKWSLIFNAQGAQTARNKNYPVVFLGGHYPQAPGPLNGTGSEQYNFTVRQSFNSAAYADGYWIWTDWYAPEGWSSKQAWIDAMMACWKPANRALEMGDYAWASRQFIQIADPNGTPPKIVLTRNSQNTVTAWNPLTGNRVTIDQTANPMAWGLSAQGDVDGCAGLETVSLVTSTGTITIQDPSTQVVLLKFPVGTDQIQMQLIQAEIVFEPVSIHGTVAGLSGSVSVPIILELSQASQSVRHMQVFSDAAGGFTLGLDRLPAGLYDLAVKAEGRLRTVVRDIPVVGNPTEIGTLTLNGGDANGDDVITFEDFCILQNNYGQSGKTGSQGDFNGDGTVDFADFSILQNNYGRRGASLAAMAANADLESSAEAENAANPCTLLGILLMTCLGAGLYGIGWGNKE